MSEISGHDKFKSKMLMETFSRAAGNTRKHTCLIILQVWIGKENKFQITYMVTSNLSACIIVQCSDLF